MWQRGHVWDVGRVRRGDDVSSENSSGGCGCIGLILWCILIWALLFGVTVDGQHYLLDCSCDRGVQVLGGEVSP